MNPRFTRRQFLLSGVTLAAFSGAKFGYAQNVFPIDIQLPDPQEGEATRIIVLGDFGTSDKAQYTVAKALVDFANVNGCNFALTVGDNFYNAGVKSTSDKKFSTAFTTPYGQLEAPFYPSLGNHDYGYLNDVGNVQAQIDYSKLNDQWRMPGRYYKIQNGNRVDVFVLDTNTIKNEKAQLDWLKSELSASTATFRLVVGHHPIYSNGDHGNTGYMIEKVLPILNGAPNPSNIVYCCGHDHHLEYLVAESGLKIVLSGGGAYHRSLRGTARAKFQAASTGFAYLVVNDDDLQLTFVNGLSKKIFQQTICRA